MIRRLPPATEQRLLKVLKDAAGGRPLEDECQACCDCADFVERIPAKIAGRRARSGKGRKTNAIRVIAELAARIYWAHTGKGPGRAEYVSRAKHREVRRYGQGGNYPEFVRALANAAGIAFDDRGLYSACHEARRALNAEAKLTRLRRLTSEDDCGGKLRAGRDDAVMVPREERRATLLGPHNAGEDDDSFAVVGGYEPALDNSSIDAAEVFKHLVEPRDDQPSEPQSTPPRRSLGTAPRNSR